MEGVVWQVSAGVLTTDPAALVLWCVPASPATHPPQGMAELYLIIKLYLRKHELPCRKWGFEVENVRNSPVDTKVRGDGGGGGGGSPRARAEISPQSTEAPVLDQKDISWRSCGHGELMLDYPEGWAVGLCCRTVAQGKCLQISMRKGWGGQSSSDKLPGTDHGPLCHSERGKEQQWNEEVTLSLAEEGVEKVLFKLYMFLSLQVYFNWHSSCFSISWICFPCDNKWFPHPYLKPRTSSPFFLLLPCWAGGMREGLGGCLAAKQRQLTTLPFYLRSWDAPQRMPLLGWDGHAVVIAPGICVQQSPWVWGCLTCSLFVFNSTILVDFWMVLLWLCFSFISPGLQMLPHCVYQATTLISSSPSKDHFLHLPCKAMRTKVSLCLQSQQTVCMSNKLILSFSPHPHHGVCASFLLLIFLGLSCAVWGWVWSFAVQDCCIAWFRRHKKPVPEFLWSNLFANQ